MTFHGVNMMATATLSDAAGIGVIEPHILYHIDEARRRLGWGKGALRAARRKGLEIRYAGRRGYVLGRDIIEYIRKHGTTDK